MSIQDDIFDIQTMIEQNNEDQTGFERIVDYIGRLEREAEETRKIPETIVAAAVQFEGVTFSLPQPARHGQVLQSLELLLDQEMILRSCQGFLTSAGRFVNRVQAKQIAHIAGQPIMPGQGFHQRDAFSEDFW